jgi:hypothetical protein
MIRKKRDPKENLELAEEHIDLAEDLILEEAKNCESNNKKALEKAAFELEKAESNLKETE